MNQYNTSLNQQETYISNHVEYQFQSGNRDLGKIINMINPKLYKTYIAQKGMPIETFYNVKIYQEGKSLYQQINLDNL